MTDATTRTQRISSLRGAAEAQRRSGTARYTEAAAVALATKSVRGIALFYLTAALLLGYFGGTLPAWAAVVAAVLLVPGTIRAFAQPAERLLAEGEASLARAHEADEEADALERESRASTSAPRGASLN